MGFNKMNRKHLTLLFLLFTTSLFAQDFLKLLGEWNKSEDSHNSNKYLFTVVDLFLFIDLTRKPFSADV